MDSTIVAVVVYPDRARLLRRGEVNLTEGVHHIEIPNLSVLLDPESVRATVLGSARTRLSGLRVQKKFYTETPEDYVSEMESHVEVARDELSRLDSQMALVNDQKTKIGELAGHTKTYARAMARGQIAVVRWRRRRRRPIPQRRLPGQRSRGATSDSCRPGRA